MFRLNGAPATTSPKGPDTTRCVAITGVTVTESVAADCRPGLVNVKVSEPAWETVRPANVATPLTAVAVCGPPRSPPDGFEIFEMDTRPVKEVSTLSRPSSAVTVRPNDA